MPENIGPPSRSRDIRFSRSSSFTPRAPRRCAVKGLWRDSPRVRANLMVGNLRRNKRKADYHAASVAALSDEASGGKDTLLRDGTLWPSVRKTRVEGRRRRSLPQGAQRYTEETVAHFLWICSADLLCVPRAPRGNALCSLRENAAIRVSTGISSSRKLVPARP